MNDKLRQIVSKAAGTYFIVTDNSQVATIEADSKMRLFFINTEKGAVNTLFNFTKGDTAGFISVFGRGTRLQEKRGNFSISTCLEALSAGPIAVINLRVFDDSIDETTVVGLNPNTTVDSSSAVPYTKLFNTNTFWSPKAKNIPDLLETQNVLSFGNIGTVDTSIIVTLSTDADVLSKTSEGSKSLANCALEIDEYPALDFEMLLKDTFVNVYVFNNPFNEEGISTNKYYGHLFNNSGQLDLSRISELLTIPEAGFKSKFTGSMIPSLISENSENISIDDVINSKYTQTGLIATINHDVFEQNNKNLFDVYGVGFFAGVTKTPGINYLLSHVVPETLTETEVVYPPTVNESGVSNNVIPAVYNNIYYGCVKISDNQFEGSFEQGLRIDDLIKGANNTIVKITSIEEIEKITLGSGIYTKVIYTCSGNIEFNFNTDYPDHVTKLNLFTKTGLVHPFPLISYKPRETQFTNGSSAKQAEILDMMVSPGIVKGLKSSKGIRYIVDCFKSFVESGYKNQFGSLAYSLDEGNRFVRAIINEPFIEDLQKSANPLFKQTPTSVFDWSYVPDGGNKSYSTKLFSKFILGADLCFWFGPGNIVNGITRPVAGLVSNLFYLKNLPYDVIANASGYLSAITELESEIDDTDRAFCEKFGYNPIITMGSTATIYGNRTGLKANTAQQQIHNSELLAYIKESLYSLAKTEAFTKNNYDDYLRIETESTSFFEGLVLGGAVKPNPIIICNASNNTTEIQKQRMKLIHIEYTPIDASEKIVFDLQIN